MQVELARTFIEIEATGSFVGAAERLNVTQSTVSSRIMALERSLGRAMFVRNRAGVALTPAGAQFKRHAIAMIRIWEQARQDAAVPPDHAALLRMGGEAGLWNRLLHKWVPWMRANARHIALRCELGLAEGLARDLIEGLLDVAVTYTPHGRPGLRIDLLVEEELLLLEADSGAELAGEYLHLDWGQDFHRSHRLHFPDQPRPGLFFGLGTLGFDYLLRYGGSGYFPRTLAAGEIAAGRVRIVAGAPTFGLPIYAVHRADGDRAVIDAAIRGLRAIVREEADVAKGPGRRRRTAATGGA